MKLILVLLFPWAVHASTQPVTLTEQNFNFAGQSYADLAADCASDSAPCALNESQRTLLGEIREGLTGQPAGLLHFASRKHHPELFPPQQGWGAEIAAGNTPDSAIYVDIDSGAVTIHHAFELLTVAFAQQRLSSHPDIDAPSSAALGSRLAARADRLSSFAAADFVHQPRVRLATWLAPEPRFELLDDISNLDLTTATATAIGCTGAGLAALSIEPWSWKSNAWNAASHSQPLEVSCRIQFRCGEDQHGGQLTYHLEFQPTFNGLAINRPDWQMVRGVQLRSLPTATVSFLEDQ